MCCCCVQDKYLQGRAERMRKILQDAAAVADLMTASSAGGILQPGMNQACNIWEH